MKKWEYKIRIFEDEKDSEWIRVMNRMGSQGWELISVKTGKYNDDYENAHYYFKRELTNA